MRSTELLVRSLDRLVLTTVLRGKSGDKQWFDASCRKYYDAKQTAYHDWCRARSADHWGRFVHSRAEVQRVYILACINYLTINMYTL